MKLATLKQGGQDGTLVVVSRDLSLCQSVPGIARTLPAALENWERILPELAELYTALSHGGARHAQPFDPAWCHWSLPQRFWLEPWAAEGGREAIAGASPRSPDWVAGIAVITGHLPLGADQEACAQAIRLLILVNERPLPPQRLAEGGEGLAALPSDVSMAFSPVAVTPDELDSAWQQGSFHGLPYGAGERVFDFPQALSKLAKTQAIRAGSVITARGIFAQGGGCQTPDRHLDDKARLEIFDLQGISIFGALEQHRR